MVPVSVRGDGERQTLGNRISFAFVDLPVDVHSPLRRLRRVQEQTAAFKRAGRPAGTEAIMGTLAALPVVLRKRAARAMAGERAVSHGPAKHLRPAANLDTWQSTSTNSASRPPSSSGRGRSRSSSTSGLPGAGPAGS